MVQEDFVIMGKVIVIAGPTASGKTKVSVEVAKKLNGEIISSDSMQIYKTLDIGTAKATKAEMDGIKHHMIDIIDPSESFSVAQYSEQATSCIKSIMFEGKVPIICGGTGLYINSLLYKKSFGKASANEDIRQKYEKILEEKGKDHIFSLLENIDEESAKKLHKNDTKRVIRALEIFEATGKKKSEQNDCNDPLYDFDFYCLDTPREKLYERINNRVDLMLEQGLLEEAKNVSNSVSQDSQAITAIGYKEFIPYFKGEISFETCVSLIKQDSRNYAKRQLTWFRNQPKIQMLNVSDGYENITRYICDNFRR